MLSGRVSFFCGPRRSPNSCSRIAPGSSLYPDLSLDRATCELVASEDTIAWQVVVRDHHASSIETRRKWSVMICSLFRVLILVCSGSLFAADEPGQIELAHTTRQRCPEILREGMVGEDFWPAIRAAEALTLGGHGEEVLRIHSALVTLSRKPLSRAP